MKIKVALVGLMGLSMIFLMGCSQYQSVFFGIRVFRGTKIDEALNKVAFDESGDISYTYRKNLADNSISCEASTGPTRIIFRIRNESKRPIRMNYFADSYNLRTKDGKIFILEIASKISEYPEYPSVINPNQSGTVYVFYPSGIKMAEVDLMAIELDYGEVIIGLKRIEELE